MAEYVKKEAYIERVKDIPMWGSVAAMMMDTLPAADVVEVVHGRWLPSESDFDDDDVLFDVEEWCDWQCSACHEDICYEDPQERRWLPKFCPNCGAKMDLEVPK